MKRLILAIGFLLATALPAQAQTIVQPPVNVPLAGCVEGRGIRIVNGVPACSTTVAPTFVSCGTSPAFSANATDFVGRVTVGTGLLTSTCSIALSKNYTSPAMACLAQTNSSNAAIYSVTVGTTTVNSVTVTLITFNTTLTLAGATTITYNCYPV